MSETENTDSRQARSFPRLHTELTELGGLIGELWRHVRGASHIVGIAEPPELKQTPRSSEKPAAPMVWALEEIHDFKTWIRQIHEGLEKPLSELVPEFYKKLDDELATKLVEKKEPSEI